MITDSLCSTIREIEANECNKFPSHLAPVAPLPLHVLLALAHPGGGVAAGLVLQAALGAALATLATERVKVPV